MRAPEHPRPAWGILGPVGEEPVAAVALVDVVLVVDAANVVGSRPDGWWRDRAGAARRLLDQLALVPGRAVAGADGAPVRVVAVAAVLEGAARAAGVHPTAPGVEVLLAEGSGDDAVVELAGHLGRDLGAGTEVVVVTADRGLRARLPGRCWGPGWLLALPDAPPAR